MLTPESVLALAPDDASAKAARGLASPTQWPTLGADDAAVWGECQGSGSKPYQTQVDLGGPTFRCSCPSRKFPCKHGLALLLMRAQDATRFVSPRPAWVDEWLASREQKEKKKEERQAQKAAAPPPDPEAVAKREGKRWGGIEAAAQDLQRWLADQLERGLGALDDKALEGWRTMAARMVDAQAPGLGQRVLDAAAVVRQSQTWHVRDWPERLLHRLGLLQLACEGIARRASLPDDMQADLRTLAGWPFDKDEVLARGEAVDDRWAVIGVVTQEREAKLVERRVWLHGLRSARRAFVLDHAFAGRGFEQAWLPGTSVDATLHYFPGAARLRAWAAEVKTIDAAPAGSPMWSGPWPVAGEPTTSLADGPITPSATEPTTALAAQPTTALAAEPTTALAAQPMTALAAEPTTALAAEWDRITRRVAASPWVWLHPLVLRDAIPQRVGDGWRFVVEGRVVAAKVDEGSAWTLLAASAGHPLHCAGEWDGEVFAPLLAWRDGARQAAWTRTAA